MIFYFKFLFFFTFIAILNINYASACSVAKKNEYVLSADGYLKIYNEVKNSDRVFMAKIISANKDLNSEMMDDCYGTSTWKVRAKIENTLKGNSPLSAEIDAEAVFDEFKKRNVDLQKKYFVIAKGRTNNAIEIFTENNFQEQYVRALAVSDFKENLILTISKSLKSIKDNEINNLKDCLSNTKERDKCFKDKNSADKYFSYMMWSSKSYKEIINFCRESISTNSVFFDVCTNNLVFRVACENLQQAQKICVKMNKNGKNCESIIKFSPRQICKNS